MLEMDKIKSNVRTCKEMLLEFQSFYIKFNATRNRDRINILPVPNISNYSLI